eukprot:INCI17184.2.p1 GENE.INCI17184.2~~INCI17184.2.p1  ORF type:complete len:1088 (-),score=164.61 INCI17184.2:2533-5796(-)
MSGNSSRGGGGGSGSGSEVGGGCGSGVVVVVRKSNGAEEGGLGYLKTREIARQMRDAVEICDRKWHFKTYEHCFVAKEAVSWLLTTEHCATRPEAVEICRELAQRGFIHHVVDPERNGDFEDKYLFYRFPEEMMDAEKLKEISTRLRETVPIRDRKYYFRIYKACFIGREAVDVLMKLGYASTRQSAVTVGRQLLNSKLFRHVCDGHNFKDDYLFYRFYVDETDNTATAKPKAPLLGLGGKGGTHLSIGGGNGGGGYARFKDEDGNGPNDGSHSRPVPRWKFSPKVKANSLILSIPVAEKLEACVRGMHVDAESDPRAAREYGTMAVGTLATCREKVAQLVSDSLEEGWELEHQSRRRGIAVHTLTGDQSATSYAMKTIGVVNVAPEQFLTTLCDFDSRRQRWEPLMIRGEVVDTEVLRMPFLHRRVDVSNNGRWSVKGKGPRGGGGNSGTETGATAGGPEDDTPTAFYYADVAKQNKSGNTAAAAASSAAAAEEAATAGPGTGTLGTTKHNDEVVTKVVPAEAASAVDPRSKYVGKVIMARTTSTNVHAPAMRAMLSHGAGGTKTPPDIPLSTKVDSPPPPANAKQAVDENGVAAVANCPSGVSSSAEGADMRSDSVVQEQKQGAHTSKAVHTPASKAPKQSKKSEVPDDAENEEEMASRWVRIVSYTIAENKRSLLWPKQFTVLQDTFKCTDGTYVLWEVSVHHTDCPKKRGHVKAEVMTKAYAAHPIAGYPGKSRVVVVTQVARRNRIPFLGAKNAPKVKARGAINDFNKLQKQALQFQFTGGTLVEPGRQGASSDAASALDIEESPGAKEKAKLLTLQDFELRAVIGRGGYGKVFQVVYKKTGEILALKAVKKGVMSREQATRTMTERSIMARVKHPFVVGLRYAFQSEQRLYMAMEFVQGGDLYTYLYRIGTVTDLQAKIFCAEITLALGHLHSVGVLYRDLKPENVLIDREGHVKLTDFGLSSWQHGSNVGKKQHSFAGTEIYMAPELLLQKGHGQGVDWWSLGILLCEMTTGRHPFKDYVTIQKGGSRNIAHFNTLRNIASRSTKPQFYAMSSNVRRLAEGLLDKDASTRLGVERPANDG